MKVSRIIRYITVTLILIISIISGPIVSGIDFTKDPSIQNSQNRIKIADAQFPESATIRSGRFGTEPMVLDVDPLKVTVIELSGEPLINYKLRIPGLRYTRTAIHMVSDNNIGQPIRLGFEPDTIPSDRVSDDSYNGELQVVARDSRGLRMIARSNISVNVIKK